MEDSILQYKGIRKKTKSELVYALFSDDKGKDFIWVMRWKEIRDMWDTAFKYECLHYGIDTTEAQKFLFYAQHATENYEEYKKYKKTKYMRERRIFLEIAKFVESKCPSKGKISKKKVIEDVHKNYGYRKKEISWIIEKYMEEGFLFGTLQNIGLVDPVSELTRDLYNLEENFIEER